MDKTKLIEQLNNLQEVLAQTVRRDSDRDRILSTFRRQLQELKQTCGVHISTDSSDVDVVENEGEKQLMENTLEDENWKMCDCKQSICQSCAAEEAAAISYTKWASANSCADKIIDVLHKTEDSEDVHSVTTKETPNLKAGESNTLLFFLEDETSDDDEVPTESESNQAGKSSSQTQGAMFKLQISYRQVGQADRRSQMARMLSTFQSYQNDNRSRIRSSMHLTDITVLADKNHTTGETLMLLLRLSPILSAHTSYSAEIPQACGVIAVAFAYNMHNFRQRSLVDEVHKELSIDACQIVCQAIDYAHDCYLPNYRFDRSRCLNLEETLLLCLDIVDLKEEKHLAESVLETFAEFLLTLQQGNILLLYRKDEYNILSAVYRDQCDDIIIFDSLAHTVVDASTKEPTKFGASIYQIYQKKKSTLHRAMAFVEKYSGKMIGPCTLALLECRKY